MLQVTFPEIVKAMQSVGSAVPVAEGHGCLCGALCITQDYSLDRWLEELVPVEEGAVVPDDVGQVMKLLYADTVRALRGEDMDFQPFLPDDDVKLEQRTAALSQWCQGFLYGLGSVRKIDAENMPRSIDEVLVDFTNIGRAEVEPGVESEEDEEAYVEVVEYVRAATQLIHDELEGVRSGDEEPRSVESDDFDESDDDLQH
ncbi:hypothetical protein HNQ60_003212 [Povalibacter uvarum]|uniref:YecA family protein n=1 Tax=Povalibacter uvarum TaxID=732238 RepID=A0A841HM60_9GAMM|nr:UPF0149 family protein [Povalibacter uvarum]MBB6094331.1 hypothetical protein [Povalibacter uvarum]